jgi:hypothetical protein
MKQVTYLLTILLLIISNLTIACDCGSNGNFLEVSPNTNLVALVKVTKYLSYKPIYEKEIPMSMEVEIIETFKGQENRKFFTVWGDNGILCRPYLSQFDSGKYYVIAFNKGSDGTKGYVHKDEKRSDYSISICGDYWLSVDNANKIATGSVSKNQTKIGFDDLREFYSGDKTQILTPKDFQEIYQLAFDLPKLQQYYHTDKGVERKQLFIKYFGNANHNKLKGVIKFGKQIKILTQKEIDLRKIKNYFVLGDWVCGQNAVRMQLSYIGEGLTVSYRFIKQNEHWKIVSNELWEE